MNEKKSQSLEDYLESILMLASGERIVHRIDVAKRMGVSGAAVNKAMKILVERGWIYEDGKHLYLTEHGKAYAERIYEKHCILRDFLITIGVSPACAEEDACHMEHVVSDETLQAMKTVCRKEKGEK